MIRIVIVYLKLIVLLFFHIFRFRNTLRDLLASYKCFANLAAVCVICGKLAGRGSEGCLCRLTTEKWPKNEPSY